MPGSEEITGGAADFDTQNGNGKRSRLQNEANNYSSQQNLVLPRIRKRSARKSAKKLTLTTNDSRSPKNMMPSASVDV